MLSTLHDIRYLLRLLTTCTDDAMSAGEEKLLRGDRAVAESLTQTTARFVYHFPLESTDLSAMSPVVHGHSVKPFGDWTRSL